MDFNRRHFVAAAVAATAGASSALFAKGTLSSTPNSARVPFHQDLAPDVAPAQARFADMPPLFQQARAALETHGHRLARRDRIAIADFAPHSSRKRFTLVNLESGKIEREMLVAHGKGSDPGHTGFLERFSNEFGSNATSRGSYCTANRYYGKHGLSQRLLGLDPANDAALDRAIVLHGAAYVDESLIEQQGRIGRSLGCFSVEEHEIAALIDALGEGRLLFAGKSAA